MRAQRASRLRQRGLRGRGGAGIDPALRAADDEGEQPARTAELAAIEDELRRRRRVRTQRQHRLRQHGRRAAQVGGDDRLVAQRRCRVGPVGRERAPGARPRPALAARTTRSKRLVVDPPAAPSRRSDARRDARAGSSRPPARASAAPGWKQLAEADARQQQIGRAAAGEQRVAEDAQEDRGAGFGSRRVQRGDAERVDELVRGRPRQACGRVRRRSRRARSESRRSAQPRAAAQQRQAFAPAPAAPAQHRAGERDDRPRPGARLQAGAVGVVDAQRHAHERIGLGDADDAQQAQGFGVGADAGCAGRCRARGRRRRIRARGRRAAGPSRTA